MFESFDCLKNNSVDYKEFIIGIGSCVKLT